MAAGMGVTCAGNAFSSLCHARKRAAALAWSGPSHPEVAMKSDWLPEAVLAVAFAVALFSQSARLFP